VVEGQLPIREIRKALGSIVLPRALSLVSFAVATTISLATSYRVGSIPFARLMHHSAIDYRPWLE
jgi:hypothetical protein